MKNGLQDIRRIYARFNYTGKKETEKKINTGTKYWRGYID